MKCKTCEALHAFEERANGASTLSTGLLADFYWKPMKSKHVFRPDFAISSEGIAYHHDESLSTCANIGACGVGSFQRR